MTAGGRYVPRDPKDIELLQGWRKRIKELEKALKRAVEKHGHDFHCSASRGLESECHCGWTEIRKMAEGIKPTPARRNEQS